MLTATARQTLCRRFIVDVTSLRQQMDFDSADAADHDADVVAVLL